MNESDILASEACLYLVLETIFGLHKITKQGETISAQEFRDTTTAILNLIKVLDRLEMEGM